MRNASDVEKLDVRLSGMLGGGVESKFTPRRLKVWDTESLNLRMG